MAGTEKITPVILSGGAGTRLWPLSRALYPKQIMALTGDRSLLRDTADRVADTARFNAPLVICNDEHRFLVAEQLTRDGQAPGRIVLEPVGRNTAPAACVAALQVAEDSPEGTILLLPSDHAIADRPAFLNAVAAARRAAADGWLVTFGIAPARPETGYGYIKRGEALAGLDGCHAVDRFVEKPDRATAEGYLGEGGYFWNSGMFLFRADRMLEEMERYRPAVLAACREALGAARSDLDFLRLDADRFGQSPSVSIDRAVMEKTGRAAVVPADMAWSDVGSWQALWELDDRDIDGNALHGDVLAIDSRDTYLRGDHRLVAALGVDNLTVVATKDSVLVCPRDRTQDIRLIVDALEKDGRSERLHHPRVFRPWGSYESIDRGEGFQAKHLIVNPGASISLQRHRHRAEHWVVVRGLAEVTRDKEIFTLRRNQSAFIPLGAIHRLRNPGDEPLHIVEVQSGDYLGEDDIERFEDIYGRVGETPKEN